MANKLVGAAVFASLYLVINFGFGQVIMRKVAIYVLHLTMIF